MSVLCSRLPGLTWCSLTTFAIAVPDPATPSAAAFFCLPRLCQLLGHGLLIRRRPAGSPHFFFARGSWMFFMRSPLTLRLRIPSFRTLGSRLHTLIRCACCADCLSIAVLPHPRSGSSGLFMLSLVHFA